MISHLENRQMNVDLYSGGKMDFDNSQTWVDMFIQNAKKAPDHIAVVDRFGKYTYRELDMLSDTIACYFLAHQYADQRIIAVKMSRTKEYIAVILGINKAGAAYLSVDPNYPPARVAYMLENSGIKLLVDDEMAVSILNSNIAVSPVNRSSSEDLAFLLYTSGSTGTPKGAMISHRAVSSNIGWNISVLDLGPEKRNAILRVQLRDFQKTRIFE